MTLDMKKAAIAALLGVCIALVLALGFAGWLRNASDLVLAYGYAGLSWCL